ncbi:MAG: Sec-independent protein translocase protein TatB [Polyangiales bacterium]
MFNIGFSEMLVICLVLIIVVGPERLPAMMKTVGKAIRSVRQASRDIQTTVGLDELWREDLMHTPPPPLAPPPAATVSRDTPAPTPVPASPAPQPTAAEAPAAVHAHPLASPEPAASAAAEAPVIDVAPAQAVVAPGGSKGEP